MKALEAILEKLRSGTSYEPMEPKEREEFRCDTYNKEPGKLTDYDCKICLNKGDIWVPVLDPRGKWTHVSRTCKCMEIRNNILRMKKSGLKDIIKDYTFEKFEDTEPWQKLIKTSAMDYASDPKGWFFLGGQSGAGKTHLCTAICRKFLLEGKRVHYMMWRDDIVKIKNAAGDPEVLEPMLHRLKTVDVLYIDDLFKTGKAADGSWQRPTSADINYAFEIINYRYCNPDLLTIISSEWTEEDLLDIDEAIGGRIFERSKRFSIARDRSRNYRTRKAATI